VSDEHIIRDLTNNFADKVTKMIIETTELADGVISSDEVVKLKMQIDKAAMQIGVISFMAGVTARAYKNGTPMIVAETAARLALHELLDAMLDDSSKRNADFIQKNEDVLKAMKAQFEAKT
jgi:F420-0:gamma-glutamyl ligase-like protein